MIKKLNLYTTFTGVFVTLGLFAVASNAYYVIDTTYMEGRIFDLAKQTMQVEEEIIELSTGADVFDDRDMDTISHVVIVERARTAAAISN